jgi:hypothetical protein
VHVPALVEKVGRVLDRVNAFVCPPSKGVVVSVKRRADACRLQLLSVAVRPPATGIASVDLHLLSLRVAGFVQVFILRELVADSAVIERPRVFKTITTGSSPVFCAAPWA